MNPNTILQSNLLDIIFENRNKEYGAYVLRKTYHHRLRLALVIAAACTALVCLFIGGYHGTLDGLVRRKIALDTDRRVFSFDHFPKAIVPVTHRSPGSKKISDVAGPPALVDSVVTSKMPVALAGPVPLVNGPAVWQGSGEGPAGGGDPKTGKGQEAAVPPGSVNRDMPLEAPDVMPQYPGGIAALLAFLKANLVAPDGVNPGEDVSVRVRFVVNYDGRLEGFAVVQSGGRAFDEEVLRVLKKMPVWIPGKSNGENVSVYFVVPVRFTGDN